MMDQSRVILSVFVLANDRCSVGYNLFTTVGPLTVVALTHNCCDCDVYYLGF